MRTNLARKRRNGTLGLTSLIDVIFLLLMFFMLSTSFLDFREIDLQARAPEGSASGISGRAVILRLEEDGFVRLNGERISFSEINPRLATLEAETAVVQARGNANTQALVTLMELLRASGLRNAVLQP